MPEIDCPAREVRLRFAIVGPIGAGKATTLRSLHASLPPSERTGIAEWPAKSDLLLSFDFAPGELLPLAEYRARATLATFSAPLTEVSAYARVYPDLDALLFVADSRPAQLRQNLAALKQLGTFRFLREVPVVLFYNRRDVAGALPIEDMDAQLNPLHAPRHAGVATTGEGLDRLLGELTRATIANSA